MPLYTAITQDGSGSDESRKRNADEITRIHSVVMKVPKDFVRVVFLSYMQRDPDIPAARRIRLPRSTASCEAVTPSKKRQTC
jgi:hypothetical protein